VIDPIAEVMRIAEEQRTLWAHAGQPPWTWRGQGGDPNRVMSVLRFKWLRANPKAPPSERCRAVYEMIIAYTEEQGYPPSVREITDACAISSTSVTQSYLGLLQDWGYIRRVPYRARGIQIVGKWKE